MFKTVSLPDDIWIKVIRRLTAEVGADDESRKWAAMIKEQTSGGVSVKALKGGDLRRFLK